MRPKYKGNGHYFGDKFIWAITVEIGCEWEQKRQEPTKRQEPINIQVQEPCKWNVGTGIIERNRLQCFWASLTPQKK